MTPSKPLNHRRRFPAEIISRFVWLYFRFSLSYRDVPENMAEPGVILSYEAVRDWCQKFGGIYAKRLRSRAARLGDRWHLDEVYLSINGKWQYLWRAVDQDGEELDILVQPRRNEQAAKAEVMPGAANVQDKGMNNRAENSHQPTRERERRMRGFKSAGHAQRFLVSFSVIASYFRPSRHLLVAKNYREVMRRRFTEWESVVSSAIVEQ